MENFSIKIRRTLRVEDNSLYMEFEPENPEISDKVTHGHTSPIEESIAATISAYEPAAARAMLEVIEQMFPGVYMLDTRYA